MFKIPYCSIRIGFYYGHWVGAAEMTHEGMEGVFCWSIHPLKPYYSFGLMKETAGSDYLFVLTHGGELKD